MGPVQIADGVFWVGAIDLALRDFHGFETPRGTTYNSYLVVDETVALIDTVKAPFADLMLAQISRIVDPADIELVVANHVEMDHSSGLPAVLARTRSARLVASGKGAEGLEKHYQRGWAIDVVRTGEEIDLGKRRLRFIEAPMVHWPDSMFTYLEEDRVLFSSDAFGQHFASVERFDDQVWDDPDLMVTARDYFANIVLPYSPQVIKAVATIGEQGVDPAIIAPSHGVSWRAHITDILGAYDDWCHGRAEARVLVVYDTMWGSTQQMAEAIAQGVAAGGIHVSVRRLGADPLATIVGEMMMSRAVLVGGPTQNAGMYPRVGGFLTYLKGLRPKGKLWGAFGSYGWAAVGQRAMREVLQSMDGETLEEVAVRWVPTPDELGRCFALGREVADRVREAPNEDARAGG